MSKILTQKDYNLLTQIMQMPEQNMLASLKTLISKRYKNVVCTKDYLFAIGQEPVCVIAHVDTVFATPPEDIYYDQVKNVMWSPQGLGADDRVGIFLILKILESGKRPSIIVTTGEESGGLGASKFIQEYPNNICGAKYLIELDRHGDKDCVFYNCGNQQFKQYIESYDFETKFGTFTDISIICPHWDIAGVNLSVGYKEEHSYTEHLKIGIMMNTLEKVKKMITDSKNASTFDYQENKYLYWEKAKNPQNICYECMNPYSDYMGIDYITKDGQVRNICDSCFSLMCDDVNWCSFCYRPYEKDQSNKNNYCCPICAKEGAADEL